MVGEIVFLVTQIPCNSITKRQDQTLKVRVNYTYKGPAIRGRLVAWVTHETAIQEFNKIGSTEKAVYVDLPAAETPQSLATDIPNLPLAGVEPKANYGILVRVLDLDGEPEWGCKRVLTVTAPPEVFKGTISKKELEYNETRGTIPVSNVTQGKRGLVHIWGRNDMAEAQRMGISWVVKDPNGLVVEEYSAWEAWPYTGAGSTHEFIGGRFNLNKAGTYTINVGLFMNPDNPVYVDTYYGTLCTVVAAGGQIALTAGWNQVTYTGVRQTAGVATQSIASYLEVAYYYDQFQGIWVQIVYSTILEPGMALNIKVSQNCVWTF